ncbi:hypothetical protein ABH931_004697 [Streptacidiphilus sp. MAP12-33]|uniref:hypothetical protein n=1 Tax=Streptacidiphilus sp. MAP12-33 TaxID=3156266 RepID=UPI0035156B14
MPRRAIPGLSAAAMSDVRRLELRRPHGDVTAGATELALRRYREFALSPGRRPLYPRPADCPAPGCDLDDVRYARSVLDEVLRRLPPRARAELGRQVAALDVRYLARTLPDPFADERRPWNAGPWWYRRLESP